MPRNLNPSVIVVVMATTLRTEPTCTWCEKAIADDDGFRLFAPVAGTAAEFCRLEHVIPWLIKGARWRRQGEDATAAEANALECCSWCEAGLGPERILLVRHRGVHRVPDAFCDLDHLEAWAKAGGRFR